MAGKLVQVATNTVTSAVASVTLTGIDSDNPYMVAMFNVAPAGDNKDLYLVETNFIDGKKFKTLSGPDIENEFINILQGYIETKYRNT